MALRHRVSNQQAAEAVETELVFPGYSSRSHTKRSRHANLLHRLALNPRLRTLLRFVRSERAVLVVLTLLAFATRFYRLAEPRAVVFDELHFGGFMEAHLQRKFTFDIHPWLGKLTIAFFAWLMGYRAEGFEFNVAQAYPNTDYYSARIPSAVFGSLCIPVMYSICRSLGLSISASILGAVMTLFDNLLLIESRLILLDAQLIFYIELTLLCALRLWRQAESGALGSRSYYGYLAATAISGAAAMSVKWTAAVTPFLIAIVCAFGVWFLRKPMPVMHCIIAACIGLSVYVVPWFIQVRVATVSTSSATRMGDRFRSTLHGNASFPYDPSHNVTFAETLYELHWRQYRANQNVKTRHKWETKWYEWPLNLRGIYYYVAKAPESTDKHPRARIVYLLQNPAGALWVFAAVVAFIILLPCHFRYRVFIPVTHPLHNAVSRGSFLLSGYIMNLVPYMFVERCCFLYHYLPALMYGQLLTALLVDSLPRRIQAILIAFIGCTVVAAFYHWSPWVYALSLDSAGLESLMLMPRWN